ncbi:MAG TPA: response regulator, partial [Candidatus Latescibacteria bacterium]|nr:response regulator [Candidatus Latescibacterota bacterium]
MIKRKILWVDDEIDLLRPHIIFLGERGYSVSPATNGKDALCLIKREPFDLVLLDEMMPGLGGLSLLSEIKEIDPNLPVVMITKSEEEELMEEAIGKNITDYLTKPVNPSQILSVCKRILDAKHIRGERIARDYAAISSTIRSMLSSPISWKDWIEIYSKLSEWDLEIEGCRDHALSQIHADQRRECNAQFGRYVEESYPLWLRGEDAPPLSVDVVSKFLSPLLASGQKVFFVIIDCMRLDQWLYIKPLLAEFFNIRCNYYYSILPTATPYSRNALFSGLFPDQIAEMYPEMWKEANLDEQGINRYEHQLLDRQLRKLGFNFKRTGYIKVFDAAGEERLAREMNSLLRRFNSSAVPLVSIVFNFIDVLAHGRSKSEILHQIAPDEAAFRSLTRSWFNYSVLFTMLREIADTKAVVVLTSDHGSIFGNRAT